MYGVQNGRARGQAGLIAREPAAAALEPRVHRGELEPGLRELPVPRDVPHEEGDGDLGVRGLGSAKLAN